MEGNANSSFPCHITTTKQRKGARNKRGVQIVRPQSDQKKVVLVSQTHKRKAVALGNLVTTDSTHVIGGNMLGEECFGVAVHVVSDTGNEGLPKPYGNLHTLRDTIGCCIAWPKTQVKRPKSSAPINEQRPA